MLSINICFKIEKIATTPFKASLLFLVIFTVQLIILLEVLTLVYFVVLLVTSVVVVEHVFHQKPTLKVTVLVVEDSSAITAFVN